MIKKKKVVDNFDPSTLKYFDDISKLSPLTREEEYELWRKYKDNNDLEARNKLLSANLKFVSSVAKQYIGKGLSYSDLIAEGNVGLLKSLDKFDGNKGFKTISYSVWWIRQTILEALTKRNNVFSEDLPSDFEQYETEDEIVQPLDVNINDNFIDNSDEERNNNYDITETLTKLFAVISDRERKIIEEYYGLNQQKPKTLEQIGKSMGLTKERIRQIMEVAKKKMRCEAMNYLN